MDLVDTHCHPHFDELQGSPEAVIERAKTAGVKKIICVGVSLDDSQAAIDFASKNQNVWAAAGVHPYSAQDFDGHSEVRLRELLNMLRIVAVGEIGLDYHRPQSAREAQRQALKKQIRIGQDLGLPLIFHVRDAWADFWQILDEHRNLRGVIHSFTGGSKQLEQALARGFYIALNGIVTFTKDEALLEAAKKIPLDKLVLETDAPFLLPAGSKNKVCEPSDTKLVAEFLAELRGQSLKTIAAATSRNANELFGLVGQND